MITNSLISNIQDRLEADLNYIGIGTGAAPTQGSTSLASEQSRKTVNITRDANTSIFEGYWDETEANGTTYTNTGVFINGTETVDSGLLGAGGAINVQKNNTQSLTVSIEITVEVE